MCMAMLEEQLQYPSPGRQLYYWFGGAYAVIENDNKTHLKYIATEAKVKEALANSIKSRRAWVNEVLEREQELARQGGNGQ